MAYIWLAVFDGTSLICAAYLIAHGYQWWAILFLIFAFSSRVTKKEKDQIG